MTPKSINKKYKKRIITIMNEIRNGLVEEGLVCSKPYDMTCDDYRYGMYVQTKEQVEKEIKNEGVDVWFVICESEQWDGEKDGVNFMIDFVSHGGEMLGGLCPFNYTENVWVSRKDPEAIEERFKLMEQADVSKAVYLIQKHLNKSHSEGIRNLRFECE